MSEGTFFHVAVQIRPIYLIKVCTVSHSVSAYLDKISSSQRTDLDFSINTVRCQGVRRFRVAVLLLSR